MGTARFGFGGNPKNVCAGATKSAILCRTASNMIIQSVRLKNIKCYGERPDGKGITIGFQPGVNCVAGRNGHGKTTLIEALGYALFCSEPHAEENFRLPTYFLRAGEKDGEMDVVFSHEGQSYRLERGLGQTRRKRKV